MNFLIKAFLSAVLIFSVFFTVESEKVRGASRKCSRELQEIVYNPKSEKSEYFSRLEKEFRLFSPLLFGSQQSASAAIWSFEDKYNPTSEEDHLKFKYLISVDGNTCAWMRVPWIMLSNSVLLKQETTKMEWFYPALKAFHNYIPLREDLRDLFEKYEWLKQNDKKIQAISENATNFVENNLSPEDIDKQMVIILNEYAKIQEMKKITPSLISADKIFSIKEVIKNYFDKIIG